MHTAVVLVSAPKAIQGSGVYCHPAQGFDDFLGFHRDSSLGLKLLQKSSSSIKACTLSSVYHLEQLPQSEPFLRQHLHSLHLPTGGAGRVFHTFSASSSLSLHMGNPAIKLHISFTLLQTT